MKYLKKFNEEVSFQNPNGKTIATHTFGPEEHGDFCLTVSEWVEKNKKSVSWCLYSKPNANGESFGLTTDLSNKFWDKYVNGEKKFTLVEMDDKLIGVLHEGGKVLMAFDEIDVKVDPNVLKGLVFTDNF